MPKATVSREHQRYELKSCPGGFVILRTLSYAEMLSRQDIASRLINEAGEKGDPRMVYEILSLKTAEWEFQTSIVDHNLEDDNGVLLDFRTPMAMKNLDPKIGAEIGRLIDSLNKEDEDPKSFTNAPSSFSTDEESTQVESSELSTLTT